MYSCLLPNAVLKYCNNADDATSHFVSLIISSHTQNQHPNVWLIFLILCSIYLPRTHLITFSLCIYSGSSTLVEDFYLVFFNIRACIERFYYHTGTLFQTRSDTWHHHIQVSTWTSKEDQLKLKTLTPTTTITTTAITSNHICVVVGDQFLVNNWCHQ